MSHNCSSMPKPISLSFDGVAQRFHYCYGRVGRLFHVSGERPCPNLFELDASKFFHLDHSRGDPRSILRRSLPCDIFTAWPEPLREVRLNCLARHEGRTYPFPQWRPKSQHRMFP